MMAFPRGGCGELRLTSVYIEGDLPDIIHLKCEKNVLEGI